MEYSIEWSIGERRFRVAAPSIDEAIVLRDRARGSESSIIQKLNLCVPDADAFRKAAQAALSSVKPAEEAQPKPTAGEKLAADRVVADDREMRIVRCRNPYAAVLFWLHEGNQPTIPAIRGAIASLIDEAVAAEREACAKLVEKWLANSAITAIEAQQPLAAAIRSRKP